MLMVTQAVYDAALKLLERLKPNQTLYDLFIAYGTNRDQFQRHDIQTGAPIWTPFQSVLSHANALEYKTAVNEICAEFNLPANDSGSVAATALELATGGKVEVWGTQNVNV